MKETGTTSCRSGTLESPCLDDILAGAFRLQHFALADHVVCNNERTDMSQFHSMAEVPVARCLVHIDEDHMPVLNYRITNASAAQASLARLPSLQVRSVLPLHCGQFRMEDFTAGVQM